MRRRNNGNSKRNEKVAKATAVASMFLVPPILFLRFVVRFARIVSTQIVKIERVCEVEKRYWNRKRERGMLHASPLCPCLIMHVHWYSKHVGVHRSTNDFGVRRVHAWPNKDRRRLYAAFFFYFHIIIW